VLAAFHNLEMQGWLSDYERQISTQYARTYPYLISQTRVESHLQDKLRPEIRHLLPSRFCNRSLIVA